MHRSLASFSLLSLFVGSPPVAAQPPPARPGVDAPALAALGSYAVGVATVPMGKSDRKLQVTVWYPANPSADPPITYHSTLVGSDGKPAAFTMPGIAVPAAPPAPGRFPLVILAHGYSNTPEVLAWLGENLATKGYVVAAPAFRDPGTFDAPGALFAFTHRPADITEIATEAQHLAATGQTPFGHTTPDQLALIGYSMGGFGVLSVAGAVPPAFPHLRAVVAISPASRLGPQSMLTPTTLAIIHVPTFFIGGSQDHVVGYNPGIHTLFDAETNARRYLLTFREAGHNIALGPAPSEMRSRLWDQDWFEDPVWRKDRLTEIEAHFITAFLDRYMKDDMEKATYIDGLIVDSDEGVWPNPLAQYGSISPGPPAATLWKGFQPAHAAGMILERK